MSLGTYGGWVLPPGMLPAQYTAEHDISGIIYGSPHHVEFLTNALVDGAARDAGNTADPTVLRPGLIMAQNSTTKKWQQFVDGAVDGTEQPAGILAALALNTQLNGTDQDRFLAMIMICGKVNPEGLCIATKAAYGIDKVSAPDLSVRKGFLYAFQFSDDFMAYTPAPFAGR